MAGVPGCECDVLIASFLSGTARRVPDTEVEGEPEYEVEQIVEFDTPEHPNQYKVRWKGYQENDDSWEPIAHLENSPELLEKYHSQNNEKTIPRIVQRWIRNWKNLQGASIVLGGMYI